jgi:hypothetical protein
MPARNHSVAARQNNKSGIADNLSISGVAAGVAFFFAALLGNDILSKIKV